MVRISDILRKKLGLSSKQPEENSKEDSPSGVQMAKAMSQQPSNRQGQSQKPEELNIAKVMKELQPDKARSKNLYVSGIDLAEGAAGNVRNSESINLEPIMEWISKIVDNLVLGDTELLSLFYENTPENYLYSHMANAVIMSVEVGVGCGYNKSRLNKLGLAAFLMDIGMFKFENIVLEPRQISKEELQQVKGHPLESSKVLSQLKGVSEAVICAVKEHHERINGKGYPEGLKDTEITEYAKIITIIDAYEALTHDRPSLKKISPHEAIKEMLYPAKASFDKKILKVLIDKIGIYPIGSWVELNTNEIGKVINVNDEFPLRPVVNIIFDSARNRLAEPRVIDLARQTNLFIKGQVSDEEVSRKTKKEGGD